MLVFGVPLALIGIIGVLIKQCTKLHLWQPNALNNH